MKERFRLWLLHTFFGRVTSEWCWRCYHCLWLNNRDENTIFSDSHCDKCGLRTSIASDNGTSEGLEEIQEAIKEGRL